MSTRSVDPKLQALDVSTGSHCSKEQILSSHDAVTSNSGHNEENDDKSIHREDADKSLLHVPTTTTTTTGERQQTEDYRSEKSDGQLTKATEDTLSHPAAAAAAALRATAANPTTILPGSSSSGQSGAYAQASPAPFHSIHRETRSQQQQPNELASTGTDLCTNNETGGSSTKSLIQADPVDDEKVDDLEEAQPVLDMRRHKNGNDKKGKIFLAVVVLVSIAIGVSLVVVFLGGDVSDTSEEENPILPREEITPEEYLYEVLSLSSLIDTTKVWKGDASNNTTVPQQLAFNWLAQDPNLKTYTNDRVVQCYALATLFYSTQGVHWIHNDNWLSYEHHECDWYASDIFTAWYDMETSDYPCSNNVMTGQSYERLWLPMNNLNGTLPDEIYALTTLESVEMLYNTNLMGTISTRIGQLSNLAKISFIGADIWGTLPTEIGGLSAMRILYFDGATPLKQNKLHGTLPTELLQLRALEQFTFNFQNFSGTLPAGFAGMTGLFAMGLKYNRFHGTLPSEWGQMTQLRHLKVSDNRLTGTIPSDYRFLDNLITWHAYSNQLSGTIPTELLSTSFQLKELLLSDNTLHGTVPSELGRLTSLNAIYLSENRGLTGSLPLEFEQLSKVEAFDISGTSITGSIPALLQQAQMELSFERFLSECARVFPCPT